MILKENGALRRMERPAAPSRLPEKLPEKRQTLMFSATMPPEVEKLAMDLLHEPESVKVDPVSSTVKKIDQCLYYVDKANKKVSLVSTCIRCMVHLS